MSAGVEVVLRDGGTVLLRPIDASDADGILSLHSRLSDGEPAIDRDGRALGERPQCWAETSLGQDCGVKAA